MAVWKAVVSDRPGCGPVAAPREIGAPAEPRFGRDHKTRVRCTAGTFGFCGCAISERPNARTADRCRRRESGCGIPVRTRRARSRRGRRPSRTRGAHHRHHPAAPGRPRDRCVARRALEAARCPLGQRRVPGQASSTASSAAQFRRATARTRRGLGFAGFERVRRRGGIAMVAILFTGMHSVSRL